MATSSTHNLSAAAGPPSLDTTTHKHNPHHPVHPAPQPQPTRRTTSRPRKLPSRLLPSPSPPPSRPSSYHNPSKTAHASKTKANKEPATPGTAPSSHTSNQKTLERIDNARSETLVEMDGYSEAAARSGTGPGKRKRRPSTLSGPPATITNADEVACAGANGLRPKARPGTKSCSPIPENSEEPGPVQTSAASSSKASRSRPRTSTASASTAAGKKSTAHVLREGRSKQAGLEAPAAEQTSIMPEAGYISDEDTSALLLAEPDVDAEGDGFDSPGPTPERLHAPRVPLRVGRLARQQPGISSPPPLLLRGGFSSASANALSPPTFNRGGQSSQSPQSPSKKPGSRPDEQTLGTKVSKHGLVGPCRKLGAGGKASHKTAYSRVKYMPGVGDSSRFPVNGLAMWNTGTAYNCRGSAHDQDESDPDEDEDDYHQAMLDGGELDTIDSITSPSVDGRRTLSSFGHASEADDTPATTPRSPESTCELPPEHEETAAKASPLGSSGEKPDDSRSSSEPFPKAGGEKAAGKSERNTVFAHALPTSMSMSLQRTPAHAGALTLSLPYDATAGLSPRVHFSDAERQQNGLFTTPIVERRRHVSASSFNLERLPAGPGADEGPGTPSSSSKGPVGLALMGTSPLFSPCHALELGSRLSRPSSPFAMAGLPPVQSPAPLVLPPSQHLQKEVRIKEEEAEALCATANEQRGPKQLPTGRPSTGSSKLANSLLASTTESSVFAVKQEPADCPNFSTSRSSSLDSFGRDSSWFDRSCSPCSDASDVDDACFDMLPPETMGLNELDRAWDPVDVDYDSLTGDDHAKVGIELKSSVAGQPMDVDDDASARSKLKDGGDPDLRPAKMPRRSTRAR